jgi:hypothetical protein
VEGDALGVAGAHEHGVLRFGLAVDGTEVALAGEAPAEALFGFERAPETEEERAVVAERLRELRADAGSLVSFAESNRCYVNAISVDAPAVFASADGAHAHDDPGASHDPEEGEVENARDHEGSEAEEDAHDHEEDGHLEVAMSIGWSCEVSPEGYPATLQVSRLIPRAELVDLTVVTSRGSGGARVGTDAVFRF